MPLFNTATPPAPEGSVQVLSLGAYAGQRIVFAASNITPEDDFVFPGSADAPKQAARADVLIIDRDGAEAFDDHIVSNLVLAKTLRAYVEDHPGEGVVYGCEKVKAKGNDYWAFSTATPEELSAVNAHYDGHPAPASGEVVDQQTPKPSAADEDIPF